MSTACAEAGGSELTTRACGGGPSRDCGSSQQHGYGKRAWVGSETDVKEPMAERGERPGQGTAVVELEPELGRAKRQEPREQKNEEEANEEPCTFISSKNQTRPTERQGQHVGSHGHGRHTAKRVQTRLTRNVGAAKRRQQNRRAWLRERACLSFLSLFSFLCFI
jgi:hypothetical protein